MSDPQRILVTGGNRLDGTIRVGGAKNSALKLMAATLLAEGTYRFANVPRITDVALMSDLLRATGTSVDWDDSAAPILEITVPATIEPVAPYELVEQFRASIVVLGPMLARCGEARVALPGGDDFGPRPIDMHVRGLTELGVEFETKHGYIHASAPNLLGARVLLEFPSVGATENLVTAAVRAKGKTVIDNAAREPEIADLCELLNKMGARIEGSGSSTISIEGVEELHSADHTVIPDRIEAATYLSALAVAGGEMTIEGARHDHMVMLCQKFGEMGMRISPDADGIWAFAGARLRASDCSTLPYPGLATDFKPFLVAVLATADGVGIVTENLFAGRFRYVDELRRMGADIDTHSHHAVVRGVERLSGAPVKAHDIRAGAALVIAGLAAEGETVVAEAHHVARGYDDIAGKLNALGADIRVE
ncbi:MAG: UDP-N-acetylglucosamine 1-carboxyvinyltransferase [Acidimicrobiales bacterium]|jgi:UDP-N-acetylglucosamine 1-carboxyvinyltransferase|nr:UDP-N-acetylglucosamine 1-carboxyvinyltransferase [Acidimicrobiales bacterium]